MKRFSILGGVAISLFALPALAQETAYTTGTVALQAGPAPDYPAVGTFGAGTPVTLYGCLDGYNWCDVSYQDARGWVDGQALAFPYEDQRVPVAVYGPELSLPIVTFSFGDYWEHHYRDRPFYAERERFERHAPPPPPPHRDRPPPLPARGGPPVEGRPGEAHPPERGPGPGPHPGPEAARPEPHPQPGPRPQPEARPQPEGRPQPEARQPVAHPVEQPRPQQAAPAPHPQPAARPPEPHPQAAPHQGEEHHEGPADQPR